MAGLPLIRSEGVNAERYKATLLPQGKEGRRRGRKHALTAVKISAAPTGLHGLPSDLWPRLDEDDPPNIRRVQTELTNTVVAIRNVGKSCLVLSGVARAAKGQ